MEIMINDVLKIKKYPNRKLYNTKTSKYINNATLASYIKQGLSVQVVKVDGTDVTSSVVRSLLSTVARNIPQQEITRLVAEYAK